MNVSPQSAEMLRANSSSSYECNPLKYCQHCSYKQAGGGGLPGSSRERKTGHTVAAEKCQIRYQWETLERTKVEKHGA